MTISPKGIIASIEAEVSMDQVPKTVADLIHKKTKIGVPQKWHEARNRAGL